MKHEAKQRDIYFSSHSLPWANSPCFYLILPGIWWDPSIPELGETDTVKTSVKTLICSLHPSLPVLVCFLQRRASIFNFFCCWGFYIPNQTTKEWYFPLVQVFVNSKLFSDSYIKLTPWTGCYPNSGLSEKCNQNLCVCSWINVRSYWPSVLSRGSFIFLLKLPPANFGRHQLCGR